MRIYHQGRCKSMQFPQKNNNSEQIRSISTSNIEALAQFQVNKNRHYTQLQPGSLVGDYSEVNLGDVQIFRESLTAGARIVATPSATFVPFAAISPESGNYRFCGKESKNNTLLQATGGEWDICFKNRLDYVCAAFNRETLNTNIELLTGREIPAEWLVSKASVTNLYERNCYAQGVATILQSVQCRPEILQNTSSQRMLSDATLKLALNALMPTTQFIEKLKPQARRIQGVRRVIDYLQFNAAQLPTIPELCKIAKLSERSLEYGFREYLGVTPVRYLRLVRLNGVRRDLLAATPKETIVNIALNWGFLELGRFAGEYRQLFEELPSETHKKNWNKV